jgi:cytochrome c556
MKLLHLTLLAAAAASFPLAAEDDHFVTSMKSINAQVGALRKMEKKTGPEAAASAEKIAGAYENMIAFWRQRSADDAVRASEAGKTAAVQLSAAAHEGNAEAAQTAFAALGSTCKGCHEAHREKLADGTYKIK